MYAKVYVHKHTHTQTCMQSYTYTNTHEHMKRGGGGGVQYTSHRDDDLNDHRAMMLRRFRV